MDVKIIFKYFYILFLTNKTALLSKVDRMLNSETSISSAKEMISCRLQMGQRKEMNVYISILVYILMLC